MIQKITTQIHKLDYGLLLAFILPLIAILPTFGEGLVNGADAPFHAHRIYALSELYQAGQFYPRWVTYFHMGYGYPVFNFYASGATHIGTWIHLLGFDVVTAYHLTNALMWSIGSTGIYLLARTFLPIKAALIACILWAYAPSRFYEFWWQGSLAQTVATSFISFVFYGIIRTTRQPTFKNTLWIAIPFATIVLSHTPTTYITGLFVAPFCIVAPLSHKSISLIVKRWFYIGIGLVLSAGLSAIFLIPVFAEVEYVRIAGELPDTVEFLRQGFITFSELFTIPPVIDSTDVTLIMPRTLGLIGGILSLIGIIALLIRRKFTIALLLTLGLGIVLFFVLEASLDLWLILPGFRNLRFPERILRIGTIFIALLGASTLLIIPYRLRAIAFALISGLVIAQALPIMHPRDDDRIWDNLSAVDEMEMEFTEKNWGTTAYDEYEPIWGEVTPLDMPPDVEEYIENPLQIRILEIDAITRAEDLRFTRLSDNSFKITLTRDRSFRFRQYYFPGWQLTVNGEDYPIRPDERFGLIKINLPEGEHILQLDYVGTPIQHLSTIISILSVLVCVGIFIRKSDIENIEQDNENLSSTFTISTIVVITIFAIFNTLWLQANIFRIKSPPEQPHYMQTTVNATFDDTVTLLGYTLDSNNISPDNPLGIRLYWKLNQEADLNYRPIIQLVNLNVSESWAVSQPLDFEGGKIKDISLDEFMSDGHKLELMGQTPPYVGQISIQLEESKQDGELTTLDDGSNRLILPDMIRINTPSKPYNGSSQNIQFGDFVTLDCIGVDVQDNQLQLDFWWSVTDSTSADYKLFVHGLDTDNQIIHQADEFPIDGLYPTSYWKPAQTLNDQVTLTYGETMTTLAIGLYNPTDGTRLPIQSNGSTTDTIQLPIETISCAP